MKDDEKIEVMFSKGVLISKELLNQEMNSSLLEKIEAEEDILVLNNDYTKMIFQSGILIDWYEIDRGRVDVEKERDTDVYHQQLNHFKNLRPVADDLKEKIFLEKKSEISISNGTNQIIKDNQTKEIEKIKEIKEKSALSTLGSVQVFSLPDINSKKFQVKDFTKIFSSRYQFIERLLRNRQELKSILSINRILSKSEKENVSLIGLVGETRMTKNGNLIATIEDPTGEIRVLFSKNKNDLMTLAKDLVPDEVIGINGTCSEKIIFADNIIWPSFPGKVEVKSDNPQEGYAVFLSDMHVGSTLFLKEEFDRFLGWINGQLGDEKQKKIASKVKYIFVVGDLVDGIGIYPSQESELTIKDIFQQYKEVYQLLKQIPTDKTIIICPGNHDTVRLADPQPIIYPEYAPNLYTLPNLISVTSPGLVNIGQTENFPGFDVLMYHGYSFDFYVDKVESIRTGGGYHRSDLIMKFLLQRRHLAPSFKSTPYFPGFDEDFLLIKKIPDFFVTGHIHYSSVAKYKGVTMISCSCWQGTTSFQEKLGHQPEPARVPIVNLNTREVKILRFDQ